jgi:hypothetical protein
MIMDDSDVQCNPADACNPEIRDEQSRIGVGHVQFTLTVITSQSLPMQSRLSVPHRGTPTLGCGVNGS